jgi:hypothetical protein
MLKIVILECTTHGESRTEFPFLTNIKKDVVRLGLLAESFSHSAVFFSHNKSAKNTFCHGLSGT